MAGADRPEDLRCACKTKFAEVTEGAISIGCDGCDQSLILPFARVLAELDRLDPARFDARRHS
jgi:hypothetical protein